MCCRDAASLRYAIMSAMAALLAGDFDDDDDDDDESFEEGNDMNDDDADDDADEDGDDPVKLVASRLPLHALSCAGKVDNLRAVLEEGARTGRVTIGTMPDGTPRTVSFDLNQSNEQSETPLHATILAAAEALALVAAPSDDPWVRAAAREDARLLAAPVASPLANASAPTAAIDAEAEARLACVKLLLEAGAERERKVYGRSALHLVCACAALPSLTAFASKAAALLLEGGASISQVDACGKTPMHYAAVGFDVSVLELLLGSPSASETCSLHDKAGATALHDALRAGKACAMNARALIAKGGASLSTAADVDGFTPLHLAMAAGLQEEAKLLLANGADTAAKDANGRTAGDLAAANDGSNGAREHASRPVLLLAHPASLLHNAPAGIEADAFSGSLEERHFGQPECAARLRSLLSPAGHLRGCRYSSLLWKAAPLAQMTDVLRCHEYAYLEKVRGLCESLAVEAAATGDAAPSQPLKASVDCDTEVTQHSYEAAMRGAGAMVEAVRAVCAPGREARSAFCAVRPPGHHAGPSGAVGGQSAGFCVLANAAIGAAYAMAVHRDVVRTVAIVDFDIHHGNGTEACVQAVVPTAWTESHETPLGSISASGVTYKPWLGASDKERIFFASIHGYGHDGPDMGEDAEEMGPVSAFYPGSGGPNDTFTDTKKGPVVRNAPVRLRTRSAAWRRELMAKILVPLRAFAPDLLIISAGFDAHAHDALEAGGLHDRDYEWMTSELVRIAEDCAAGRVVSVLEGGYQVAGGFVSSLARAVGSHVSALNQPALVGASWGKAEAMERLEAGIAHEEAWLTNRAVAQARAAAASSEAPAAPEQDNGAPARRSKRSRGTVDYEALEAEVQREEGAGKKPKVEEGSE